MGVVMFALTALQYALVAALLLLLAKNWRALSRKDGGGTPEHFQLRDLLPAIGMSAVMLLILAATSLLSSRKEGESFLWQTLPVAGLIIGGWLMGRWGGRYGLAALLWTLFGLIAFIPVCALLSVGIFAAKPELSRLYLNATLTQWWETLLPNAPLMFFLSLGTARWGAARHSRPPVSSP